MCSIVKNYHYHVFNGEESSFSLLSIGKNYHCHYHRDQSVSPISVQAFAQCHSGSSQTEQDDWFAKNILENTKFSKKETNSFPKKRYLQIGLDERKVKDHRANDLVQPEDLREKWHSLDGGRDVLEDRSVCHADVDALWQLRRWGVVRSLLRFVGLRLRSFTRSLIIQQMRSLMLYRADQCIVHMTRNRNPPTAGQPLDLLRPLPPQPQLLHCSSPHGTPRSCTRLLKLLLAQK